MFLDVIVEPSISIESWLIIASIVIAAGLVVALVVVLIVKACKAKKNKLPKENVDNQKDEVE